MNVKVRAPQFHVKIVSTQMEVPDDLLQASIRHIHVARAIGQAAGNFQISLLPRSTITPWTMFIHPMSYVEISLWVPPRPKQIVMRGFVDTVAESFSIEGGTPQHQIIIAGRDYGKVALNSKLYYLDLDREGIPQTLVLFERWQVGFDSLTSGNRYRAQLPGIKQIDSTEQTPVLFQTGVHYDMIRVTPPAAEEEGARTLWTAPTILAVIFETFLEPQFNLIRDQFFGEKPPSPGLESTQDELDEVMKTQAPQYMFRNTWQPYTDVWSLLRTFSNLPWRELFWEDHSAAAPFLVSRPTPWMDEGGAIISSVAKATTVRVPIDGGDVISWSLARTDEAVQNLFFTYPGRFAKAATHVKATGVDLEGMSSPKGVFKENPVLVTEAEVKNFRLGANYKLFGLHLADYRTLYFDYDGTEHRDYIEDAWLKMRAKGTQATERLVKAFGHGGLLESGSITLKGNETIRLGCYLDIAGTQGYSAYVERVTHDFAVGSATEGRFITAVVVTRGRRQIVSPSKLIPDQMGYDLSTGRPPP